MSLHLSERPFSFRGAFFRFTHSITLIVLCLFILINGSPSSHFVKADDPSCAVTNEATKKYYDLSPLKKTEGDDWIVTGYDTEWTFHINICNDVLYSPDESDRDKYEGVGVYGLNTRDSESAKNSSLGKKNDKPFFRGDKLMMNFTGGDYCGRSNYKHSTYISFICDTSVSGPGQPTFLTTFEDCAFFFEWRTPIACPTDKKDAKGGWGVFFTIFVIALIVYFIGGIVYNRMVHNATGVYQIPNWEFWSNSFDFLKDMILIIVAQCPFFKPRRYAGRSYRNLPRDEENILIEEEFEEH